jgi:TRAP-type mannitol/chloroaromatic compound transport system permease small subunit
MNSISQWIDATNDKAGRWTSYLGILLAMAVVYGVFMRYVLNRPSLWILEFTTFLYGAHFMLGSGHVHLVREHVHIEVIEQHFSERRKAILRIITFWILFMPFVASMFVRGIYYAHKSWSLWERAWTAWAPPLYPIKTVIPIAFFLLMIQGFSNFLKDVEYLKGSRK